MLDLLIKSYFVLNILGAIYEIIRHIIKPDTNYVDPNIPIVYKDLPLTIKVLISILTFIINVVVWLPAKILKPILIKENKK